MLIPLFRSHSTSLAAAARMGVVACFAALALALTAQEQPSAQSAPAEQAPTAPASTAAPQVPSAPPQLAATASNAAENVGITEDELKQMLVGKALYLRGGMRRSEEHTSELQSLRHLV